MGTSKGAKLGEMSGLMLDPNSGTKPEHKNQLWESIKRQFTVTLRTTPAADSIATLSAASDSASDLAPDDDSLVDLNPSPMEVTSKTHVGLANLANIQMDPPDSAPSMPIDSDSDGTPLAHNKSHKDNAPPPLITLDSPDNVDETQAVIHTRAKATVTNMLCPLHRPFFCNKKNPFPVRMCGATATDMLITSIAKGFL